MELNDRLEQAMDAAQQAWWEMDLPSGEIRFSINKTRLLGYDKKDFTHYSHFTDLVDPADYKPMMKAMTDHIRGDKPVYETMYRIQAKNGEWFTFYDRGKITKREGDKITLSGVVSNVSPLGDYAYTIASNIKSIQNEE